jgi:hypothetical protein
MPVELRTDLPTFSITPSSFGQETLAGRTAVMRWYVAASASADDAACIIAMIGETAGD